MASEVFSGVGVEFWVWGSYGNLQRQLDLIAEDDFMLTRWTIVQVKIE